MLASSANTWGEVFRNSPSSDFYVSHRDVHIIESSYRKKAPINKYKLYESPDYSKVKPKQPQQHCKVAPCTDSYFLFWTNLITTFMPSHSAT